MLPNDPCSKTWAQILKKVVQFTSMLSEWALSDARVWGTFRKFYMPLTPCQMCWFLKSLQCFLGLSWPPFLEAKVCQKWVQGGCRSKSLTRSVSDSLRAKVQLPNRYRWCFLENQNSYGYLQPFYMQPTEFSGVYWAQCTQLRIGCSPIMLYIETERSFISFADWAERIQVSLKTQIIFLAEAMVPHASKIIYQQTGKKNPIPTTL